MKFGWCLPLSEATLIRQTGFDFLEAPLAPLGLETPSGLAAAKARIVECPAPIEAFNSLFPSGMKIVGPSVNNDAIVSQLGRIGEAVECAKAKIVVFGDGAARSVPVGFDRRRAEEQYLNCLAWAANALKGTGATLVIEPINRNRTNFLNSLSEAAHYAKLVNRSHVKVVADFYHMQEEQESLSEISAHKDWIVHIHLADTGRKNPGSGHYDYDAFFSELRSVGYTGRLVGECIISDPEAEMRYSATFLRARHSLVASANVSPPLRD
ncbi:MAG TPA: sugar phosphate isomerase/epimerase family protein [Pseudolabrys sp.]|jgi:sugar phosphate isomerase/epimerase|nr:sugar phosphate isomerase/epimerase family protein [Pseudolabrys sp.]